MNYWEQLLERTRQQQADKPFLSEAYDSKGGLPEIVGALLHSDPVCPSRLTRLFTLVKTLLRQVGGTRRTG